MEVTSSKSDARSSWYMHCRWVRCFASGIKKWLLRDSKVGSMGRAHRDKHERRWQAGKQLTGMVMVKYIIFQWNNNNIKQKQTTTTTTTKPNIINYDLFHCKKWPPRPPPPLQWSIHFQNSSNNKHNSSVKIRGPVARKKEENTPD